MHEYRIVRPDGTIRWIRSRSIPVRDEEGETYRISGIATDVTEEKETEGFLRKALARFYSAAPGPGEILWGGDSASMQWHFRADDRTAELFGPMPDPAEAWTWWEDRVHPEDRARVIGRVHEALNLHSGLRQEEYRFAASDGGYRLVRATAYLFRRNSPRAEAIGIIEVRGFAE